MDRQFERMYRRHAADVYRYALAVLRNPTDAEDVTQTTFMNAYRAFSKGDRPETPKNWLIAIAHNVCRQRFRQAARRPNEVQLNEDLAEAFVPEETIAVEDIQRALGHLAFNQRAALVMRELEGRSYAEIAEILEVSVAAVETLIFRARRALREQLEGALTCSEAELAISKQVDGVLGRAEKAQLRGHLRECGSCSTLARRMRAQKGAWKALGAIPLPGTLTGLFGGGGAATATGAGLLGGSVAIKAAAVVATAALASGTVYEGKKILDRPATTRAAPALAASNGKTAAKNRTAAARSAKPYAPGQVKPDGSPAQKPDAPPGQAKKDASATTAATTPRQPVGKAAAPGQAKKAEPEASTPSATPTRGQSAAAPGQATTRTKKKKTAATTSTSTSPTKDSTQPAGKPDDKPAAPPKKKALAPATAPATATVPTPRSDPTAQGNGSAGGNGIGNAGDGGNGSGGGNGKK